MSIQTAIENKLAFLTKASKQEWIKAGVFASVAGAVSIVFSSYFGIYVDTSETRCLPEVVYVGYPRSETLNRGDVVSFIADRNVMFGAFKGHRVAKIVVGMAGDRIQSDEFGVVVNGRKVADRSTETLGRMNARGFVPINMDRTLQPGELFVMGVLPRSFDSRYWGVINERSVERLVKPLI